MESADRAGPVHYRTAAVGGVNVFYREAGPDSGPLVLRHCCVVGSLNSVGA